MSDDETVAKLSDRLCDTVDQFLLELDPDGDGMYPEEKYEITKQAFHAAHNIFIERHIGYAFWIVQQSRMSDEDGLQKL